MDYISVVNADEAMHSKLDLFRERVRDGHAPFLAEADLQAYVMAGITTDHECSDFDYAMQERRCGMTVHIREGSAAKKPQGNCIRHCQASDERRRLLLLYR